eukprot:790923-Pyramimonas_sp.AAC.1
MGKFWFNNSPFSVKRTMAKGLLINAALSGLEVAVHGSGPLREADLRHLQSFILKKCRVILHGTAKWERGGGHVKTTKHEEVVGKFRFAPLFLELRVRRIKWLQKLAGMKENSSQLLSAVFGPTNRGKRTMHMHRFWPGPS